MSYPQNDEMHEDSVTFENRGDYYRLLLNQAVSRLQNYRRNQSMPERDSTHDMDALIKTYDVVCNHLKVRLTLPPKDIMREFPDLTDEVMYLSGLCRKDVCLSDDWWRHNNGAIIGMRLDGTPVALLPGKLSGYCAYDPILDKKIKINSRSAQDISLNALAIFRRFEPKRIGLRDIIRFILGENIYKEIAIIMLCSFSASIVQVVPPIVSAQIFDVIVPENRGGVLVQVILILIALAAADIGFSIIVNLGISRITTKISLSVETAVWDRLLNLKIPFFAKYTTGELLQKIKSIDKVKNLISVNSIKAVISNLFVFVNIIVLFSYSTTITPYVLIMLLGLIAVYAGAYAKKYSLYAKYTAAENKSASFTHQSVQGIYRIKTSCAEERIFNIWSLFEADKRRIKNRIKLIDNALDSFRIFFQFFSSAVIFFLISISPEIHAGAFIAYISTFLILQKSVIGFLRALNALPELICAGFNVKPILDTVPEYNILKTIPKDMTGTLEVNHATFRYGDYGRTILNDISFRVEEGQSVGVIGLSGSGKSTLLKVLMGFYELTSGKIYYGGYDLETIDLRYLRKHLGVVLQDGRLSVGDIYSNVTDSDDRIGYGEVMDAIRKAGLESLIEKLPEGLNTRLEHCPLSDGDRQKLLIARAIAKKSKFIFLDEATGSLDNAAQSSIMQNLKDIKATKIIIAQRIATIEHCDMIIEMDQGRITVR